MSKLVICKQSSWNRKLFNVVNGWIDWNAHHHHPTWMKLSTSKHSFAFLTYRSKYQTTMALLTHQQLWLYVFRVSPKSRKWKKRNQAQESQKSSKALCQQPSSKAKQQLSLSKSKAQSRAWSGWKTVVKFLTQNLKTLVMALTSSKFPIVSRMMLLITRHVFVFLI